MSDDIRRKIAALEAMAASTKFDGERENALASIKKLRALLRDPVEELEEAEWPRAMDEAQSDRIIADMIARAYRHLCNLGVEIYRDGRTFVVIKSDSLQPCDGGDVLNMALNAGFRP